MGTTLLQLDEQQIDDYCEKVLNLCLVARTEGSLMFESVQMIRQLQGELQNKEDELSDARDMADIYGD